MKLLTAALNDRTAVDYAHGIGCPIVSRFRE